MKRLILLGALVLPAPASAELGVNVYGLSYQFDRARARALRVDNEINPGIGLRYRVPHSERLDWIFDAGSYRDSGRNTALLAGAGGLYKVSAGWRVGAALVVLDSATYNRGKTTFAPVPLAAYETRPVTFNFVYLPKVADINEVATIGFWATWWMR